MWTRWGLIQSFVRSAEIITAGAGGRRNSMCLRYKVGVIVRWTASRNVQDGSGNALARPTNAVALRVLALLPILSRISDVPSACRNAMPANYHVRRTGLFNTARPLLYSEDVGLCSAVLLDEAQMTAATQPLYQA